MKMIPHISNKITLREGEYYCAIIGSKPSEGARSPYLWNKATDYFELNFKMFPFDVNKPSLKKLLYFLENDPYFLGGSIAAPYKSDVFDWLKHTSNQCKKIQSVNNIFKKGLILSGDNTDGAGALQSILNSFEGINQNSKVLLVGDGGTARAIGAYLIDFVKNKNVTIVSRSSKGLNYSKVINCNWESMDNINMAIKEKDLIINCTSLGSFDNIDHSPISLSSLGKIDFTTKVFDVIYNPEETTLIKYAKKCNLDYINGSEMNILQAVIGFSNVTKINNYDLIKKVMIQKL